MKGFRYFVPASVNTGERYYVRRGYFPRQWMAVTLSQPPNGDRVIGTFVGNNGQFKGKVKELHRRRIVS